MAHSAERLVLNLVPCTSTQRNQCCCFTSTDPKAEAEKNILAQVDYADSRYQREPCGIAKIMEGLQLYNTVNVEMPGGTESSSKVLAKQEEGLWFNSQNSVFLKSQRDGSVSQKKIDDLNSIPKTHAKVEGENQGHKVGLWPVYMYPCTHTHKVFKSLR